MLPLKPTEFGPRGGGNRGSPGSQGGHMLPGGVKENRSCSAEEGGGRPSGRAGRDRWLPNQPRGGELRSPSLGEGLEAHQFLGGGASLYHR